ncbi:hypothetical protein [Fischerella thermalis]|jgi:hypothetical protein|uniref:hypothetical protein n=1 Tax=Fischerella thermalis TaxID=372787 RepID=UPI000C802BEC|nr:hypothetical protein [Fischerella thermalis]PLZ83568.1 hypothetical protein CBP16_03450 [Fischerella thermalis WC217]PLZ98555.1 hypothetical protein CI592_19960 [Fischerella thermalis CCMEE 5328]PLZ07720.1 hypothetical protein CBP18_15495 [Fischerella thermalis WC119]PLZ13471.1 hypothetical protein CBP17_05805 [Fischerella thermalis WC114]PLZ19648.1 hypothetical protein CBP19_01220 [Fischerella thermalis WC1110]
MKVSFLPLKLIAVTTLAGIGLASLLMPQPSLAEPSQIPNLPNYDPQNNTDDPYNNNNNPFSNTNTSDGFSVFNLIHRANLSVPNLDINAQNQQLDEEAEAFKARQRALTQQNQQQTPSLQIITPGVNTTPNR